MLLEHSFLIVTLNKDDLINCNHISPLLLLSCKTNVFTAHEPHWKKRNYMTLSLTLHYNSENVPPKYFPLWKRLDFLLHMYNLNRKFTSMRPSWTTLKCLKERKNNYYKSMFIVLCAISNGSLQPRYNNLGVF